MISDYVRDELDPEIRRTLDEHLRKCPDCLALLKTFEKTLRLAKSFLAKESAVGIPKIPRRPVR